MITQPNVSAHDNAYVMKLGSLHMPTLIEISSRNLNSGWTLVADLGSTHRDLIRRRSPVISSSHPPADFASGTLPSEIAHGRRGRSVELNVTASRWRRRTSQQQRWWWVAAVAAVAAAVEQRPKSLSKTFHLEGVPLTPLQCRPPPLLAPLQTQM